MDSLNKLSPCAGCAPLGSSGSAGSGGISAYLDSTKPGGDFIPGRVLSVGARGRKVKSSGITPGCSDALQRDAVPA